MFKTDLKFEKGQSLFELVVAIAISALVITALVALTSNSVRNSTFSRNKALAAVYAQQATEWLRGQRDNNIEVFTTYAVGSYCLQNLTGFTQPVVTPATDCTDKIPGTIFSRWVTFNYISPIIQVDVVVSWIDSQGYHEVKSATNLADLRER